MKERDIPPELIKAALDFRDTAKSLGYHAIGCAFHQATNRIKAGAVSIYHADVVSFRLMVEQIVEGMNENLDPPIVLDDEWIPWQRLGCEGYPPKVIDSPTNEGVA